MSEGSSEPNAQGAERANERPNTNDVMVWNKVHCILFETRSEH